MDSNPNVLEKDCPEELAETAKGKNFVGLVFSLILSSQYITKP